MYYNNKKTDSKHMLGSLIYYGGVFNPQIKF